MYGRNGTYLLETMDAGNGPEDRNGRAMLAGVVQGSSQERSAHESYHLIDIDVEKFFRFGDTAIQLQTYAMSGSSAEICGVPFTSYFLPARKRSRREHSENRE